ncbi:MAG: hypothetical protein ICV53_08470, partial [Flavisolibacter sp.]|nr:hypothetical protein [Flavisolibacter sp.]
MKAKIYFLFTLFIAVFILLYVLPKKTQKQSINSEEEEAERALYVEARMKYEFDMLKDPKTGKIPYKIREQELAFAKTLPERGAFSYASRSSSPLVLNNYIPAGPNNIGGRTRAVAYDIRYNGSANRVIIAGCISGGILRSADGGISWTLVTPQNDIHAFTAIAQDPRPGFQDTWYAGGGEAFGNTASEVGAEFLSYGLWKSTDNGSSWTKLPLNNITDLNGSQLAAGTLEVFDHPFDFVHKIAINPVNGDVYVAGHRRLMRTSNGGTSFQVVFAGSATANSAAGQMDVIVSNTGRVLVGVNGGNPDLAVRGVWTSPSGNRGTFTRIAGGQTLGVDSVAGWRGNSYNFIRANTYDDKRILLNYAPSNQNIAYVFYENELSNSQPDFKPEADLFQLNFSGSTITWDNRSANLPDLPSQNFKLSDPLSVQRGYNMLVTVKPDNPNTVFIGGTNLYRSTDGFRSNNNTAWINGYHQVMPLDAGQYPNGHPDQHVLVFNPSNSSEAICG